MSMPAGKKFDHGYSTMKHGKGYREIALEMTSRGDKMNHATARNVFLRGMKKLASRMQDIVDPEGERSLDDIAKDPRFQESIYDFVTNSY